MATAQAAITQNGGMVADSSTAPYEIRARKMMPMVFWASFVPCASEIREAEPICPYRKAAMVRSLGRPRISR